MSGGKQHFSVSELRAYLQCPEAWYQRYVLRVPKLVPYNYAIGRAYDEALNYALDMVMSGKPWEEIKAESLLRPALDRVDPHNIEWPENENFDTLAQAVLRAAECYLAHGTRRKPLAVQDRFEVEFEDTPWTFLGYIDLITEDGWIVDNKLFSRTPTQQDADDDLQLTAYAFGYAQKYGRLPEGLALDCVVRNKAFKFVTVETRRTDKDIDRFLRILGQAADMMTSGVVLPRPGGWYCSPTACQYWVECHERW